ncbi:MAG: CapA family protein [Ignavibacteriaceae bacterium]|nr:CapA family protein [Ignavibacteriaceae bacterium]MCW9065421.1 CapA family protein [Ignavibacteriaceae bacterium]
MKNIFTIVTFILSITFQYYFFNTSGIEKNNSLVLKDSVLSATLCFVGDLMCHSTQFNYAKVDADSFDFTGVYSEVKKYLSEPDLTIGNLETVIAGEGKGYSGYPYFNAPDDFIYALKVTGFDLLVTANNHAIDQGWKGVKKTIDVINNYKIHRTGTYISQEDRDSIRIFLVNSIKIAFLAYSENTNGLPIPEGKEFVINLIDEDLIKSDIKKARDKNVDIVLVYLHYGPEYNREPSDYQKDIVQKIIELGADIIIGGHPHVIEPFDYFRTNNTKLDSGFVAYSMGNFISNQRWRYSDAGVILNIQISKNKFTDSIYINDVNYIPTWVFRGQTEKGKEYKILPSQITENDSIYNFLTDYDRKLMNEAFDDTKEIITKYNSNFKLISP